MIRMLIFSVLMVILLSFGTHAQNFETDTINTGKGDLKITFIGHGSLYFTFGDKVIQIDPYGKLADYSKFPKADMVLITHEHQDHLDTAALGKVLKDDTVIVVPKSCAGQVKNPVIISNGEAKDIMGINIEAVPAYNLEHMREPGKPYHIKGVGNGYVLTFGDKKVYIAGDTENTPEMKSLKNIDIAFLPMNLPYTMTPEMVADAAKAFKPKILYPYHTGETDLSKLTNLMKDSDGIEVRFRKMK